MLMMIVRRLLIAVPTIVVVTALLFFAVYSLMGSPAALMLGQDATPSAVAALNAKFGFDQPILTQYCNWVIAALKGDLGRSFTTQQSVTESILAAFPVTFELAIWSIALSTCLAVLTNTLVRQGSRFAGLVTSFIIFGITVPNFMLGICFIFLFSVKLGILPSSGWVPWTDGPIEHLKYVIAPVLTLSAYYFGVLSIVYRTEYADVQNKMFVQVARAKGASETSVAFRHTLPNAILPVITFVGISLGQLMGGAVVTETVFSLPGVGRLFVTAIASQDFPVMLSVGMLIVTAVIIMNVLTDVAYTIANPQISAN